jgi:predicted secreted protein
MKTNNAFLNFLKLNKGCKMKQTVRWLSLILIATIFLSACTLGAKPTVSPKAADATEFPATLKQIQVTEADHGKEYTLNPGDSLIIVLESNPSTGYAWEVKPVDNPVLQLSGEAVFKADSEKLGSPGKATLTFNAVNSGTQALTLIYHRSNEKDVQPSKTFTINVTVSGTVSSSTQPNPEIPNPAAKYCDDQGFTREIRTSADGSQYGVCKFPDESECDEWAYFRGECKAGQYDVAPIPALTPASTNTN